MITLAEVLSPRFSGRSRSYAEAAVATAPERRALEPLPVAETPDVREARPLRVLVVEDHDDTAIMLAEMLTSWGYKAEIAHTGAEARQIAPDFRPRVVLLDLGLPDQSGYAVARELRESMAENRPSFVVVTGWTQPVDQYLSTTAGISHHLLKPVNPDALHRILDYYQRAA